MSKDGRPAVPCFTHLGWFIVHLPHSQALQGPLRPRIEQPPTPHPAGLGTLSGEGEEMGLAIGQGDRGSVLASRPSPGPNTAALPYPGSGTHPQPGYLLGRAMSLVQPKPRERSAQETAKPSFAVKEGCRALSVWVRGKAGDGH